MLTRVAIRGARAPYLARAASTITLDASGAVKVPNDPIIPFIEGDGTGPGAFYAVLKRALRCNAAV